MNIPLNHWLRNNPITHRGLCKNEKIIENTIESVKESINYNYPIEIDVRVIKDNTVILFHDNNLKRLIGINKYYYNLNKTDLKYLKYKNSNCKIATLKEVLNIINGKVPLLIELKYNKDSWNMKKLAVETHKILKDYKGNYAIHSFYPKMSKIYRKLDKNHYIGLVAPLSNCKLSFLSNLYIFILLKLYKFDFLSYDIRNIPNKFIAKLKLPKIYWTIYNKEQEKKAINNKGNFIWNNKNYMAPNKINIL